MLAVTNSTTKSPIALTAQPYLCGGSAAVFAAVAIHPIDLVKVHLQLAGQTGANVTGLSVTRSVIAQQGISGLYAGLSAAVARQMVYGTARLGMHRAFSDKMSARRVAKGESATLPLSIKSGSAIVTGGIAATLGCPMDVALVRMQADTLAKTGETRGYKNVMDAVFQIARSEGVATLWRGSIPLVARGAAMNLGMMASYDQAKEMIAAQYGHGFGTNMGASAVSGFACAFTSLPFDLVKSRLMNMKVDPVTGQNPYSGVTDCFKQIITKEGPSKLWRGYWTYYTRCAPNAMIVLLVVEQLNAAYKKAFLD
uniref:Mitochondrial 2-oxoglutarate/malate carrier protein n=1 Tax=Peronospora matthiolae TaxID=2874970 RepID=A0AAV1TS44_9STRA